MMNLEGKYSYHDTKRWGRFFKRCCSYSDKVIWIAIMALYLEEKMNVVGKVAKTYSLTLTFEQISKIADHHQPECDTIEDAFRVYERLLDKIKQTGFAISKWEKKVKKDTVKYTFTNARYEELTTEDKK